MEETSYFEYKVAKRRGLRAKKLFDKEVMGEIIKGCKMCDAGDEAGGLRYLTLRLGLRLVLLRKGFRKQILLASLVECGWKQNALGISKMEEGSCLVGSLPQTDKLDILSCRENSARMTCATIT